MGAMSNDPLTDLAVPVRGDSSTSRARDFPSGCRCRTSFVRTSSSSLGQWSASPNGGSPFQRSARYFDSTSLSNLGSPNNRAAHIVSKIEVGRKYR